MVFKGIPAEPEQSAQEALQPTAETERAQPPPAATGESSYAPAYPLLSYLHYIHANEVWKVSW